MNSGSCGAPATTIPNGFHPREKEISALKNESSRHSISSVHFWQLSHAQWHCISLELAPYRENEQYKQRQKFGRPMSIDLLY